MLTKKKSKSFVKFFGSKKEKSFHHDNLKYIEQAFLDLDVNTEYVFP